MRVRQVPPKLVVKAIDLQLDGHKLLNLLDDSHPNTLRDQITIPEIAEDVRELTREVQQLTLFQGESRTNLTLLTLTDPDSWTGHQVVFFLKAHKVTIDICKTHKLDTGSKLLTFCKNPKGLPEEVKITLEKCTQELRLLEVQKGTY